MKCDSGVSLSSVILSKALHTCMTRSWMALLVRRSEEYRRRGEGGGRGVAAVLLLCQEEGADTVHRDLGEVAAALGRTGLAAAAHLRTVALLMAHPWRRGRSSRAGMDADMTALALASLWWKSGLASASMLPSAKCLSPTFV